MKGGNTISTKKVIRRVLIAIMAATALSTGVILVTHRSGEVPVTGPATNEKATLTLDKMRHTSSRQGVDEWSVEAETVNLYNTENRAVFLMLTARYFEKSGAVTTLTADKGVLDTETRNMEVSGNVVVTRGGITITSDALTYTKESQVIISTTPVVITDSISRLTGDAMFLDLAGGRMTLDGNVNGTLLEESKGKFDETRSP
ncbi:LPS export ABC transporter periplasmic protein LptC [Desulfoluna spongiiphila]|uniref:LPS export ABC transporter protein LptC n=1 Tax=Desulfoluna spongiiphila TaxID=419481 RepID=A0A1G5JD64_9BACT|nr:LPS export ABC transporter periplasmic protein LptC [Desulfoluna spongiiphila]SCY86114.1 LPS export ABC transporter protein LptC [Desulfoluna spongiiphila]VVS90839.1 lipopolysaccharide export system protein lptc [Desulfoluna spongiiphila]